jgi:membrane associated rhomboid family serine protease
MDVLFDLDLYRYGIIPHDIMGLRGILFSPFIHDTGNIWHITSNTLPFMLLFFVLVNAYKSIAVVVLLALHILTGLLVWLLSPPYTLHVGISGIIFGMAFFLVASGLFRREPVSLSIAIFVTIMYGGMVEGFVPQPGVSWQSHASGAVVGIVLAFILRHYGRHEPVAHESMTESEQHFFEEHGHG